MLDLGSTRNLQLLHKERTYAAPYGVQHGPGSPEEMAGDFLYLVDAGTGNQIPSRLAASTVFVVVVGDTNLNHQIQAFAEQMGAPVEGGPRRLVVWSERRGSRRREARPTWQELAQWFQVPLQNAFEIPYCAGIPAHRDLGITLWHEVEEEPESDGLIRARHVLRDLTAAVLRELTGGPARPDQRLHHGLEHLLALPEREPTVRVTPPALEGDHRRRHDPYRRVLAPRIERQVSVDELPESERGRLPHRARPWSEFDPAGSHPATSLRIDRQTREVLVRLKGWFGLEYSKTVRLALAAGANMVRQGSPVVGLATDGTRARRINVRLDPRMLEDVEAIRAACGRPDASEAEIVCWAVRRLASSPSSNPFWHAGGTEPRVDLDVESNW